MKRISLATTNGTKIVAWDGIHETNVKMFLLWFAEQLDFNWKEVVSGWTCPRWPIGVEQAPCMRVAMFGAFR